MLPITRTGVFINKEFLGTELGSLTKFFTLKYQNILNQVTTFQGYSVDTKGRIIVPRFSIPYILNNSESRYAGLRKILRQYELSSQIKLIECDKLRFEAEISLPSIVNLSFDALLTTKNIILPIFFLVA
jgi:hypothetical protein